MGKELDSPYLLPPPTCSGVIPPCKLSPHTEGPAEFFVAYFEMEANAKKKKEKKINVPFTLTILGFPSPDKVLVPQLFLRPCFLEGQAKMFCFSILTFLKV